MQNVTIRGLASGGGIETNPSVGFVIDDVPYGSHHGTSGRLIPDLDPGDLARVEVLRGPQGTLYGASSLGGLIKYVTVDPSTEGYAGRVSLGTTSVTNGDGLGYNARGGANVPLADNLAMNIGGFSRREPGFIDNDALGFKGVNERKVSGGRLSMLWRPSDDWLLKVSAIAQDHESEGSEDVNVSLGEFQQGYPKGTNATRSKLQAYNATLKGKLGNVNLTSITAYNRQKTKYILDLSGLASFFGPPGNDIESVASFAYYDTDMFTQEIRLEVPVTDKADIVLGAFYNKDDTAGGADLYAYDPIAGAAIINGFEFHSKIPLPYEEYAAFANVTFHLTDRLDIQVGGRQSWIEQSDDIRITQNIFPPGTFPSSNPSAVAKTTPFTYLVTPRFRLSPDLMLYARIASGYRVGGANAAVCSSLGFPCKYDPDTSNNYELGIKGDFWDRALTVDASIYYIDWQDLQISAFLPNVPGINVIANAGRARSQGVELATEYRLARGVSVEGWVSWNDAVLAEDFPSTSLVTGHKGDRLPLGMEWSGRLSVAQAFELPGNLSGSVEVAGNYVGERAPDFGSTQLQNYPAYTKYDANARLSVPSGWTADLFVNNLTDKRATHTGNPALGTVIYFQPRTVGVSLSKTFQ